tara:strand:- start:4326 stop:5072 length:747 start_codon:yes stop_codon:yes gene_type:complete
MTNIQTNNNNSSKEIAMNSTDNLIEALVSHFQDNPQGFTDYRKEVESLLKENIKPLTTRSGKAGDNWRSEVKSQFSGRGAKWVFVSLENIEPSLKVLELEGIDCSDYRKNITKLGKAWIRFSGPRINNGIKCAGFEVRTEGSTIDHPKQLHLIYIDGLDGVIETMPGTPKALKLEEDSAPMPKAKKKDKVKEVEINTTSVQAIADEINDELEAEVVLNESPQSDDPAEWEAFLKAEGLVDPEFEDYDL